MQVPINDLYRHHQSLEKDFLETTAAIIKSNAFIQGEHAEAFEQAFAEFVGAGEVVSCASGTDALILALLALGVGKGDEVITVSHTFYASVEAIIAVGATPKFVDVLPQNGLMDCSQLETAISERTKCLIPVHLYGHPVDMEAAMAFCRKHELSCVEDASQAHGSCVGDIHVGTFGDIGTFSFYPGKNLGALGDAGGLVTNSKELAETARLYRNHGQSKRYVHDVWGYNMRLDGLQGSYLSLKLPHLERWNDRRRTVATAYDKAFSGLKNVGVLTKDPDIAHSYHQYVVLIPKRNEFIKALSEQGVQTGIHYPIPCHKQSAYLRDFGTVSLPQTEKFANRCLSLPMHGEIRDEEVEHVIKSVREVSSML